MLRALVRGAAATSRGARGHALMPRITKMQLHEQQNQKHKNNQCQMVWPRRSTILMTHSFATRASSQRPPPPQEEEEEDDDDNDNDEEDEEDEEDEDEEEDEEDDEDNEEDEDEDNDDDNDDNDDNDDEEEEDPFQEPQEPLPADEHRGVVDDLRYVADAALNLHEDPFGNKQYGHSRAVELNVEAARRHQRLIDANEHEFASYIREQYWQIDAMNNVRPEDSPEKDIELEEEELADERRQILEEMKEEGIEQMCRFCRPGGEPILDPLNVGLLAKNLTVYGTIKSREQTHLCAKHQRQMNKVIRRARHMGIFSSKNKSFTVHSPFEDLIMERNDNGEWQVRPKPLEGVERKNGLTADDDPFPDEVDEVAERAYVNSLSPEERRAYYQQHGGGGGEDEQGDEEQDEEDEEGEEEDDDDDEGEEGDEDDNVQPVSERDVDIDKVERQVDEEMAEKEARADILTKKSFDDDDAELGATRRRGRK